MSIKQLTNCLGKSIIVHRRSSEPLAVYVGLVNIPKHYIVFENGTDIKTGDLLQMKSEIDCWEVTDVDVIPTEINETDVKVTISKK